MSKDDGKQYGSEIGDDVMQPMFNDSNFDELQKEFEELMKDISGDKILENFKVEFQKLMDSLKKSRDNEMKLTWKCRELNSELSINASKIKKALKATQDDQNTINQLRMEIDNSWKMLSTQLDKEKEMKDTISTLSSELTKLTGLVEDANEKNMNSDTMLAKVMEEKIAVAEERDELNLELAKLNKEVSEKSIGLERIETSKKEIQKELTNLKKAVSMRKNELEHEKKKRVNFEKEMSELKALVDKMEVDIRRKKIEIQNNEDLLADALKRRKGEELENISLSKRLEQLEIQHRAHSKELAGHQKEISIVRMKYESVSAQLKEKTAEMGELKKELEKAHFAKDGLERRIVVKDKDLHEAKQKMQEKIKNIKSLEYDVETLSKDLKAEVKRRNQLESEREVLQRNVNDIDSEFKKQEDLMKIRELSNEALEREVASLRTQNQAHRDSLARLEKERLLKGDEVAKAVDKYLTQQEIIKEKDAKISEQMRNLKAEEERLTKEMNRTDKLQKEKDTLNKRFTEKSGEVQSLKQKFAMLKEELQTLERRIAEKDSSITTEKLKQSKQEDEQAKLLGEQARLKTKIEEGIGIIHDQKLENQQLMMDIQEKTKEYEKLQKLNVTLQSEKEKNKIELGDNRQQIARLAENIHLQQDLLNASEANFKDKLEEIKQLQIQVAEAKIVEAQLRKSKGELEGLKRMNISLDSALRREQTKIAALSEELETPINVHRWRKLEGEDPDTFKLLQQVHLLQKKLIEKTELSITQEEMIKEKTLLLGDMREMLNSKPKIDLSKKVLEYAALLNEKENQRKALESEIVACRDQIKRDETDIQDTRRDLQDMTEKYYDLKRKEMNENTFRSNVAEDLESKSNSLTVSRIQFENDSALRKREE